MASQTRLHPKNVINSILVASGLSRISHILSLLARTRWLWVSAPTKAIRAAVASVGGFPLLAVLVYVAYEHPAIYAGAGTLQASVVSFYCVVVILGEWVRMGCARLLYGHEDAPSWSGSRGTPNLLRGHFITRHQYFTYFR